MCDSSATANHVYKTLDGTELLKTSNVFDLRFIPDSMEFNHPPRDVATEVVIASLLLILFFFKEVVELPYTSFRFEHVEHSAEKLGILYRHQ